MTTTVALVLMFGAALLSGADALGPRGDELPGRVAAWIAARSDTYGIFRDVIDNILREIDGDKTWRFDEVTLYPKNRFADVAVSSQMNLRSEIEESGARVVIKNLTLPVRSLNVDGSYKFEDLWLPGGLLVYGDGDFRLGLVDLRLVVAFDFSLDIVKDKFTVHDVAVEEASLGSCHVKFENLMDGEPVGDFLNDMMKDVIEIVVDLAHDFVNVYREQVKGALEGILNQIFSS